ncbi:MAG TPA: thiamine-phosphate kinase [Acidobacteriaceae bacterium]|nr:thiamine-phosphate kinase [Acidobacteriaceae bacterium]
MARERRSGPGRTAGERELIASIRKSARQRLGRRWSGILTLGIGDDCAVLRPRSGREIVVTTDLSLENVHFHRDWHPPQSVGHRCLARGLSDLAAMGARPEVAFLSLALPAELTGKWIDGFLEGFFALADQYRVPLAGGDMAKSSLVVADIVLLGSAPKGKALLRSGAHAGDTIYVTGALGGSAAELQALARRPKDFRKADRAGHPHLYPEPRLTAGRRLRGLATAAIDLSDGLSTDLSHLCEESNLAAEIDATALPIDARATLEQALHGGEDYELLFTASPRTRIPAQLGGVAVHAIGSMKKSKEHRIVLTDGRKRTLLVAGGWEHFR